MHTVSDDIGTHILRTDAGTYTYIYQGDCRTVCEYVNDGNCDLVFMDPPFNIGEDYGLWTDNLSSDEFVRFIRACIFNWCNKVKRDGVFVLHVPDEMVETVFDAMRIVDFTRIHWIIWHYKFGQYNPTGWTRSKCHCLVFQNMLARDLVFHPPMIESDRSKKYGDTRAVNAGMRSPFDVWSVDNDGIGWGRVCGTYLEKVPNHPNQLPRVYLQRLISTYTNPGDFVADPFGGTGTTAKVCSELGRHCFTSEINPAYVKDIVARLQKENGL